MAKVERNEFHDGRVVLFKGDSRDALKELPDNSLDSIATDPPYALVSIVKRFGADNAAPAKSNGATGVYARASAGFMGAKWDNGAVAFDPAFWAEALRVLKPGGHVAAFGGTRTYHRLAVAIEDAGFEIRDALQFLYGSGFPKSHNVSRNLNGERCGCEAISEHDLHSVSVANVSTPISVARGKGAVLLASVPQQSSSPTGRPEFSGTARPEQPRMEGRGDVQETARELCAGEICSLSADPAFDGEGGRLHHGTPPSHGEDDPPRIDADGMRSSSRPQAIKQRAAELGALAGQPESQKRGAWNHCERCGKPIVPDGLGTALKPACEIICLARKPLSEGTVAANVLRWGTGALNIDACRIAAERETGWQGSAAAGGTWNGENMGLGKDGDARPVQGRWPANLLHDGSEEVLAGFPDVEPRGNVNPSRGGGGMYGHGIFQTQWNGTRDSGSAARFFYTAKADSHGRVGSKHPTVKPVDLMQWLVKLITPPGGVTLDPFAGSGTTGEAALLAGFRAILVEREPQYQADIAQRMAHVFSGKIGRSHVVNKDKAARAEPLPLFGSSPAPNAESE